MGETLHFLTLAQAGALIARRQLSPVEYLEAQIGRAHV